MNRPDILAALAVTFVVARYCATAQLDSRKAGSESDRVVAKYDIASPTGAAVVVRLVEVNYGPSAFSPAHRHQCPVIGYIVDGEIKSKVDSAPATVYKTGESFYEAAGSLHAISANASQRKDAKLLAVFVCPPTNPGTGQSPNPLPHQ